MQRGKMDHLMSSDLPAFGKLRIAIVLQALEDSERVLTGRIEYGHGYGAKELVSFWRSRWASNLTNDADMTNLISDLEDVI